MDYTQIVIMSFVKEPAPANISGVQGKYFLGVLKTESSLIGILSIDAVLMDA